MDKIIINTDGGARGNPGPAGIGAVIKDGQGKVLAEVSRYIGEATNNQAEYRAVVAALEELKEKDWPEAEVFFYLDSELVVKQINREYKVKDQDLAPLFLKIHNLLIAINRKVSFHHVRREFNKEADKLVNQAIDKELKKD